MNLRPLHAHIQQRMLQHTVAKIFKTIGSAVHVEGRLT